MHSDVGDEERAAQGDDVDNGGERCPQTHGFERGAQAFLVAFGEAFVLVFLTIECLHGPDGRKGLIGVRRDARVGLARSACGELDAEGVPVGDEEQRRCDREGEQPEAGIDQQHRRGKADQHDDVREERVEDRDEHALHAVDIKCHAAGEVADALAVVETEREPLQVSECCLANADDDFLSGAIHQHVAEEIEQGRTPDEHRGRNEGADQDRL